jgi:signal transduction histidine kinase
VLAHRGNFRHKRSVCLTLARDGPIPMRPTHAASLTAPEDIPGALARNVFGARQAADDGDIFIREVKAGSFTRADPPVTQHNPSRRLARPRIEDLITADRRKDEFLAVLCHELRSPLSSIQNAIGILRSRTADDLALQRRMHALIERQVCQMTLLAVGLLDVSRITCGQLRLKRERVDLCVVLRDAIETLDAELNQRNHRVAATWPDAPVWLHADASRLGQVFVNLLANASKYTDSGGELALSFHAHGGHAVVCVRDSGIGIARDVLPHIFDLFVQADDAAARSRSGLGIGLALVRMLTELHGGSVNAASAGLGQGSEFTVRLPQAR